MNRSTKSNNTSQNSRYSKKKTKIEQLLEENEGIIEEHPEDSNKFICIPCKDHNSFFYSGTWNNLRNHLSSNSHLKIAEEKVGEAGSEEGGKISDKKSLNFLKNPHLKEQKMDELTKEHETHLNFLFTQFILQQRLPFTSIQPLINFIKTLMNSYDSILLKQYNSSRNIITRVTKSITESLKTAIYDQLKQSPFSLSVDAGSDCFGQSYFAICANFLEGKNLTKVTTKLVSLFQIKESSTGEFLHHQISTIILKDSKIQSNFMGISTDGGPNLAGSVNGVQGRLSLEYPYMVFMRDFSHIYNNIFQKALKAFPENIVKIITQICSHFEYSNQRDALFKDIQIQSGISPLGIISFVPTRWLSLGQSLERILLLWSYLETYFQENGTKAEKTCFNEENLVYLKVLGFLIEKINSYNIFFQKENLFYDGVLGKIQEGYVVFTNMIIKKELKTLKFAIHYSLPFEDLKDSDIVINKYTTQIESILSNDEEWEAQLLQSIPTNVKELFQRIPSEGKSKVLSSARNFLLLSIKKMKVQLPFNEEILKDSQVVFLKNLIEKNGSDYKHALQIFFQLTR